VTESKSGSQNKLCSDAEHWRISCSLLSADSKGGGGGSVWPSIFIW